VTVLTSKTNVLVCKAAELNELSGPGRGVTVIKLDPGDHVADFMVTAPTDKQAALSFETAKGRTLAASPSKYGVSARGGKGHEMSKKDSVKELKHTLTFIPLPEKKD
jgi:DNA gyrase subunit A